MKFGNSDITIGRQIADMQLLFPQFRYARVDNCPSWTGVLDPTGKSQYHFKITYRYPKPPHVWVLRPRVNDGAPHRYPDGSLCLFFPKDRSWTPRQFISKTIIPWTVEWLTLYEIWLLTRKWYGPEAPHGQKKKKKLLLKK